MIFGTGEPKFISAGKTVLIDHSIIKPKFIDPQELEHDSIINGTRNFITLGDYSEFTVLIYLFKYDYKVDGYTPEEKFNELIAYNHKDVDQFFPHRDGISIRDSSNNAVQFHVTNPNFYYLEDDEDLDTLELTFKSRKYTNITKSLI